MSASKAFAALLASASLGTAACGYNPGETIDAAQADISASGLKNGSVYAAACVIDGEPSITSPYDRIGYDFKYQNVTMRDSWNGAVHSQSFNSISNPAVQAEIQAAYRLLPRGSSCPAPVFAPQG